ncbi:MAG: anti-sigma factor [Roseiflexaceae bacterium]
MAATPDETMDLLAAYALGALEPAEMEQVSQLLREKPELQALVAELRATADMIPLALEATPPADLRQRTLDYATGRTKRVAASREYVAATLWKRLTLAFGGATALLAIGFTLLIGQLSATQAELARSQAEQRQIAAVMAQPNALVSLTGAGGQGAIVQNANGDLVMAVSLPPLQPGRAYQLWFIRGNQAPIPSTVFQVDQNGVALVTLAGTDASGTDTFAITDEPASGSDAPTTSPLLAGSSTIEG